MRTPVVSDIPKFHPFFFFFFSVIADSSSEFSTPESRREKVMIVGNELSDTIANISEDDVWIVHPIPGYVVKFKEVRFYFTCLVYVG